MMVAAPAAAQPAPPQTTKLKLTLACWDYDRTRALLENRVALDGIELTYLNLVIEETFFRMARYHEFDASEMSLSSYVILNDEYKVPISSVTTYTGGLEEPGREEKLSLTLPPEIKIQPIPAGKTLSQMLETGEIDAMYTPRAPSSFISGSGKVRRLFQNYAAVEREYYQRTKIFPIMHVIAIRRDVYEKNPWVAQSLYKGFVQSQRQAYEDLHETAALKYMLPWLVDHVEETEKVMGKDFWKYGYEPNVQNLSTFLRYSYEQGLAKRLLAPRDLFAPESLESFKI